MAVTVMFEEFEAHPPGIHPISGAMILAFEDPATGTKYIFPMEMEMFDQYFKMIQDAMGKRVQVARNMEEAVGGKAATGNTTHVPTRPRR